jgi:hypothetical protein
MVKSGIVVLTEKKKADADVAVGWMLQPAARAVLGEKEREN